jgi:hypothetical protein
MVHGKYSRALLELRRALADERRAFNVLKQQTEPAK